MAIRKPDSPAFGCLLLCPKSGQKDLFSDKYIFQLHLRPESQTQKMRGQILVNKFEFQGIFLKEIGLGHS
jgi:hypothetical protein